MPPDHVSGQSDLLKIVAYVDGGSRGNPGPAGYGAFLTTDEGEILEVSGFLGVTTNNVAEYAGLIAALEVSRIEGAEELDVVSDSLLLVNQMLGKYKVKHPNLVPLFLRARDLTRAFSRFSVRHTMREGNRDADRLANFAIDGGHERRIDRRMT